MESIKNLNYYNEVLVLQKQVSLLKSEIDKIKNLTNEDLWDNSEMIINWNISKRTLATWRAEGMIDYVQAGGKIWYTKKQRDDFLERNTITIC